MNKKSTNLIEKKKMKTQGTMYTYVVHGATKGYGSQAQ